MCISVLLSLNAGVVNMISRPFRISWYRARSLRVLEVHAALDLHTVPSCIGEGVDAVIAVVRSRYQRYGLDGFFELAAAVVVLRRWQLVVAQ